MAILRFGSASKLVRFRVMEHKISLGAGKAKMHWLRGGKIAQVFLPTRSFKSNYIVQADFVRQAGCDYVERVHLDRF